MSLSVVVGVLIDDPNYEWQMSDEDKKWWRAQFNVLKSVLRAAGLPDHYEPEGINPLLSRRYNLFYSQIHDLRRITAYLCLGLPLPDPGNGTGTHDPVLRQFYADAEPDGFASYSHLITHSDCEGYYVPISFEKVLFVDQDIGVGSMVGSSQILLDECRQVAEALHLPLHLDPESAEVIAAEESSVPTTES